MPGDCKRASCCNIGKENEWAQLKCIAGLPRIYTVFICIISAGIESQVIYMAPQPARPYIPIVLKGIRGNAILNPLCRYLCGYPLRQYVLSISLCGINKLTKPNPIIFSNQCSQYFTCTTLNQPPNNSPPQQHKDWI